MSGEDKGNSPSGSKLSFPQLSHEQKQQPPPAAAAAAAAAAATAERPEIPRKSRSRTLFRLSAVFMLSLVAGSALGIARRHFPDKWPVALDRLLLLFGEVDGADTMSMKSHRDKRAANPRRGERSTHLENQEERMSSAQEGAGKENVDIVTGETPFPMSSLLAGEALILFANGALENGVSAPFPEDLCTDLGQEEARKGGHDGGWFGGRARASQRLKGEERVAMELVNAWAAQQVGGLEEFYSHDKDGRFGCHKCTLYDKTAGRIESCAATKHFVDAVKTNGAGGAAELWVVPPEKWFVFPTGELGRTVTVKRVPQAPFRSAFGGSGDQAEKEKTERPIVVETISHSPRVFHLHNFLTEEESDELVARALADKDAVTGLQRSTTGAEHQVSFNKVRTSDNAFDSVSPAAQALKRRAIDLLGMTPYDEQMTDGLQVLRYNASKAYIAHLDYLDDNGSGHDYDSKHGGSNRFATILFYLSDVEEGGETVFAHGHPVDDGRVDDYTDGVTTRPFLDDATVLSMMERGEYFPAVSMMEKRVGADGRDGSMEEDEGGGGGEEGAEPASRQGGGASAFVGPLRDNNGSLVDAAAAAKLGDPLALFERRSWEYRMVAQCRARLSVRPKKAHAVLFYSQQPDGSLDKTSKHGGCPVLKGTKWAANLWIWNRVRLGYPRAPRKRGASKFDASAGIGRDRMVKKNKGENGKQNNGQSQQQQQQQPVVRFDNVNVPNAKLFFRDTFMGDLAQGASLSFNTFTGHEWNIRDGSGAVVHETVIDDRPEQIIRVALPESSSFVSPQKATAAREAFAKGTGPRPPRPPGARPPA